MASVEGPGLTPGTRTLCHVFAVISWSGGEPTSACDEHSEIRWLTLEELQSLPNVAGLGYLELAERAISERRSVPVADRHD